VALGLVLGKPIGIMLASWLAVCFRLAVWPEHTSWTQMLGAACLCGIGFTMALFIATLAFGTSEALAGAKLGILLASVLAGLVGSVLLTRDRSVELGDHH
jgi:Na+:H+ antiporter, NhaA family